jgi:hypothetical protein
MKDLNHQKKYAIGSKFKHVSEHALVPNAIFTVAKCVDPETEVRPDNNRLKENEVFGIALCNPKGENYSHIIYKGSADSVEHITHDEFRKITANSHLGFEFIG